MQHGGNNPNQTTSEDLNPVVGGTIKLNEERLDY
jgi:hypothetical protein